MFAIKRLGLAALALGSVVAIGGCADDYGYDGVAIGYAAPGYDAYYDGYAEPYYGYPGNGFGYYGWYGGYYYPGSGGYVYDRYRRPLRWNGDQRRYWQGRYNGYRGSLGRGGQGIGRPNWGGFNRGAGGRNPAPVGQAFRGGTPGAGGARGGYHGGGGHGGGRHR